MDGDPGAWNVVVTAQEGAGRSLRRALRPVVALEWSAFRNVALARVEEPGALLDAVAALRAEKPRLDEWLGKIVPVEVTFAVEVPRLLGQLEEVVTPWLGRLAGGTFHVRVVRRGHKGVVDSHALERSLGARVVELLAERGQMVRVSFDDPDLVLQVEIVGDVAGVALLSRELRVRYPFVRSD